MMKLAVCIVFLFSLSDHGNCDPMSVAVTFDDLPAAGSEHPLITRKEVAKEIISVLEKHKVGKIFGFMNGSLAHGMSERLEILSLWKKHGFLLGNHTYSHLDLTKTSSSEFIQDIERNESTLIDFVADIPELKWFRYPFLQEGESNLKRYAVRSYLAKRNYKVAPVSIDFEDWNWNEPYIRCSVKKNSQALLELENSYVKHGVARLEFAEKLAKKIYGASRKYKHILLIHFNAVTAKFLDPLLSDYEKKGVKWITLQEAMTDPANLEDTTYVGLAGKTNLQQGAETRGLKLTDLPLPQTPSQWLQAQCH
jgi:peptidoglycan/xylan/chitin deacetylase (PgdA/CDA1 family)